MSDCIHDLSICDQCGGLDVVQLNRVPGIASITLDGDNGRGITLGNATLYIGPAATDCPNIVSAPQEQQ